MSFIMRFARCTGAAGFLPLAAAAGAAFAAGALLAAVYMTCVHNQYQAGGAHAWETNKLATG